MTKSTRMAMAKDNNEMVAPPQAITSNEGLRTDFQKSSNMLEEVIGLSRSSVGGKISSNGREIIMLTMITPCNSILMTLMITTSIIKTRATRMEATTRAAPSTQKTTTKTPCSMIDTKDHQCGTNSTTLGPCTRDMTMLMVVCLMMSQWAVPTDNQQTSSQTVATASSSITTVVSTCSEIILLNMTTTIMNQMNGQIGHSASDTKTTTT